MTLLTLMPQELSLIMMEEGQKMEIKTLHQMLEHTCEDNTILTAKHMGWILCGFFLCVNHLDI